MKSKSKEYLEKIGKKVTIEKVYERRSNDGENFFYAVQSIPKRHGWVVGITWLNVGKRNPGSHGGYGLEYECELPTFKTVKRIFVVKVIFWSNQKPVYVPEEALHYVQDDECFEPYTSCGYGEGSNREYYLKHAREWKYDRDEKGRFK